MPWGTIVRSSRTYVVTVFVAGGVTMAIETAVGRVLAPTMGVSLFSWTAIIGVVLLGLAIGSWLGGWLADRGQPGEVLVGGAAVSSVGGLAILPLSDWTPQISLVPSSDVIGRTVWISVAVLTLPSLGLGVVLPASARLAVRNLGESGRAVGRLYAANAGGSILGVFVTGFVLIDALGSRGTIVLAAAAMLGIAVIVGRLWEDRSGKFAMLCLGMPFAFVAAARPALVGPCTWESAYFCIQIREETTSGRLMRSLMLDRLVHGFSYVEEPTQLEYGYVRVMADVTDSLFTERTALSTLFIGGGSYTLPRYIEARYPRAEIDVLEIDPKVTQAAHVFLGLYPLARVRSHNLDARQFLIRSQPREQYDVVYGDAFNDLSVPYHLTTREFAALVRDALRPDGMYLANVIDIYPEGRFLRSFVATLREEFAHVYLVVDPQTRSLITPGSSSGYAQHGLRLTFIVAASKQPIDFSTLGKAPVDSATRIPPEWLDTYVSNGKAVVLTDDFAPVDDLVAPIFLSRPF